MVLEHSAFEILYQQAGIGLHEWFGDRVAEQGQALPIGDSRIAQVEPMALPVRQEVAADIVVRFVEVAAGVTNSRRGNHRRLKGLRAGEVALGRILGPESPELDLVGRAGQLGMIFEALPLEILRRSQLTLSQTLLGKFLGDRKAKDRQSA